MRCPSDRYQPFAYSTNEINECIYMKSNCTEEGQIISDHGTGTHDSGCKCDYTKGYTYVTPPINSCNCHPVLEDCSCYAMKCFNTTYELSPGTLDCHVCYLSHALRMQFVLFYFFLLLVFFMSRKKTHCNLHLILLIINVQTQQNY